MLREITPILIARGAKRDAISLPELFRQLQTHERPEASLRKLFQQVDKETATALEQRLPGLPIASVVSRGPQLQEAWVRRNTDLIKAQPRVQRAVEQVLAQPLDRGLRVEEIKAQLEDQLGIASRRAQLIARDQTLKLAGQLQEARQTQAGIRRYVWTTSGDERVRHDHAILDGTIQSWNSPPVVDQRTGRRGHPGDDFQCLPGGAKIGFTGPVERAFRRWYCGKLTELITDSGETLECTPNHPILTSAGWQAAERVQVGQDVFKICYDSAPLSEADVENRDTLIADVFETLSLVFGAGRKRGVASQFHGDGVVDEEVEIVDVQRELRIDIEAALAKHLRQLNLSDANASALSLRQADAVLDRLGLASASGIRSLRLCLASFLRRVCESNDVRFRTAAWLHSLPFDEGFDGCAADAVALGQALDRGACDIRLQAFIVREWLRIESRAVGRSSAAAASADHLGQVVLLAAEPSRDFSPGQTLVAKRLRIVQKRSRVFEGHVYNLSTDANWYVAQTLCVHNCRCTADPVLDEPLDGLPQQPREAEPTPPPEPEPEPVPQPEPPAAPILARQQVSAEAIFQQAQEFSASRAVGKAAASADVLAAIEGSVSGKSLQTLAALPFDLEDLMSDPALKFLRQDPVFAATGSVSDNHGSSEGGLPQVIIEPDGSAHLVNGRHRLTAARELGLRQIVARVRKFGPRGGLIWKYIGLIKV